MNFIAAAHLKPHHCKKIRAMDERKLIIPAEIKVCATCSYWDGQRRVDDEIGVVVVSDCSHGECLIKGEDRHGLQTAAHECECMWEDLAADDPDPDPDSSEASTRELRRAF